MAKQSNSLGHQVKLMNSSILSIKSRHKDHFIREEIEIKLHPTNMNKENGLSEQVMASHMNIVRLRHTTVPSFNLGARQAHLHFPKCTPSSGHILISLSLLNPSHILISNVILFPLSFILHFI
jgi:hypothetical protein